MEQARRGRPPKQSFESKQESENPVTVDGLMADKTSRKETMAVLHRVASIVATGNPLTHTMAQELKDFGLEFIARYDTMHMASAERKWAVFQLEQSPHLLRTVHDMGLPKRFLNGAVNHAYPNCSSRCLQNKEDSPTYWREHVLAGDLVGMSRRKVLASYGGLSSSIKEVDTILRSYGIELAGQYPEKWVSYENRIAWR